MGVFSNIKPVNSARKNPFPLGNNLKYNTKVGTILPLKFFPTLPSSEYEFDLNALMRTQPLNTAAFSGFKFNYDVVWTPYNDHYSSYNQFIAQRLNKQHVTQPDIQQIPHFHLNAFKRLIVSMSVFDTLMAETTPEQIKYYHDNQDYEITMPYHFLVRALHNPEESMALGAVRTLDMLEYGNLLPIVKALVTSVKKYLDDDVSYPVPGSGGYDGPDLKQLPYIMRFCGILPHVHGDHDFYSFGDLRGHDSEYGLDLYLSDMQTALWDRSHGNVLFKYTLPNAALYLPYDDAKAASETLWPVMTYNKAFWQFYRNEWYDIDYDYIYLDSDVVEVVDSIPYVNMFNMDDISSALIPQVDTMNTVGYRLLCMFATKPHQYKKDLFTGVLPSTQYGSVSVAFTDEDFHKFVVNPASDFSTNVSLRAYKDGIGGRPDGSAEMFQLFNPPTPGEPGIGKVVGARFDPSLSISVLELRKADAMQRFNERMLRAGNKTADIFKAHGWDAPKSEKAFDVLFLGSYDSSLDLNVVASTNASENVDLGQLAANGISVVNGSTIRFKSHDFGSLLVIAYVTKEAEYDSYGVHKSHSLLEAFDFPYPELQNVSLAPITKDQLTSYKDNTGTVLGFLPQNMCYKTQVDQVHGEFYSANPFSIFGESGIPVGIFSNMVAARQDIQDGSQSLSFFYIQPSCADNIFVVKANSCQDTDPIFGLVNIKCNAVQPLDVIGLPI